MNLSTISILICATICIAVLNGVDGSVADRDLTLSPVQKNALDKLKNAVQPLFKQEYKKREIYLIKWLRGANFDPKSALQKIKNDVQWRKEMKMDTIHEENWSDFRSEFEYTTDSVDKAGQPLLIADMGNWDFRQAMVSGQRAKLQRYIFKMLDEATVELRKRQDEGKLVTRSNIIINLDGYNTVQHGCIPCISLYLSLATALDPHFPELFDQMIIVNAPTIFEVVLSIVKPALPKELQQSIVLFGTNKRDWQKYLAEIADEDQLPFEFGGTKLKNFVN